MRHLAGLAAFCILLGAVFDVAQASETQTYSYDALGRLTATQSSGSVNNGLAHSLCYDAAGNRSAYQSSSSGTLATCGTGSGTGSGNQPPVANPDSYSIAICGTGSVNVIANDTDPDGNTPLTLIAVDQSWAYVQNGTTVGIFAPSSSGTYTASYTVQDSLGATSTGILTLNVYGSGECN